MRLTLLILFSILWNFTHGQIIDTIRPYNPDLRLVNHSGSVNLRVARFDVSKPFKLLQINLIMDGAPDSFTVHLYGHEGGTAFPQLFQDLVEPMRISKSIDGYERIRIELDTSIILRNNQCFVAISDLGDNTYIKQSVGAIPVFCESTSGGNYYYQYMQTNGNWSVSSRAFAISLTAEVFETPGPYLNNQTTELNLTGSGDRIAVADINNDGLPDILQGGQLHINNWWDGRVFSNITTAKGITGNPRANAMVDMDNDGDLDLLFLGVGDSCFVYENDGKLNFSKHHIAGIPLGVLNRVNTMSFADINGDNLPDLFVGQLWETYPNALPKFLFANTGNLDFTDISNTLYPTNNNLKNAPCRGSQFVDVNNDGCQDLFIANYVTTLSKTTSPRDELWLNNGDGSFTNIIEQTGIDTTIGANFWNMSSGCHWSDFDNDGDQDLLAPTLSHPRYMNGNNGDYTQPTMIYRNLLIETGSLAFEALKDTMGIEYEETHAGATWGDYNNDGLQDFFISSFYGCRYNDVYVQLPNGKFELTTIEMGLHNIRGNQDGVWADINVDGKLDLLAGGKLYINKGPFYGNWIHVTPRMTSDGPSYPIGAEVTVYSGKESYSRIVTTGRGQKMQRPYSLHFGLGFKKQIDSVVVHWPGCNDNSKTVYTDLSINDSYILNEEGDITLSIPNVETRKAIRVFPNPSRGKVTVQAKDEILSIFVMDLNGRIVKSFYGIQGNTSVIDLSDVPSQVLVLKSETSGGTLVHRIILQ